MTATDNTPAAAPATPPTPAELEAALKAAGLMPDFTDMVRYNHPAPGGMGASLSPASVAELGAVLASAGAEKGAATKFIAAWQNMAIQFVVQGLPSVISDLNEIQKARIMRVMQEMKTLQKVTLSSSTTWKERMNGVVPATYDYVALNDVLRVLANALDRPLNM